MRSSGHVAALPDRSLPGKAKRVALTAEPYAFGPSSKMLVVARHCLDECDITVVGRGIVAEFARMNGLTTQEYSSSAHVSPKAFAEFDLVVNVMNFELSDVIKEAGVPSLYIDTLFWYWATDMWAASQPDLYLCQAFPGTDDAIEKSIGSSTGKLKTVGPLVDLSFLNSAPDESPRNVLVNLGGLESDKVSIGNDSNYPTLVLDRLLPAIRRVSNHRIVVATRSGVARKLEARYDRRWPDVHFEALPQAEFLRTLSRTDYLLTTPGLESVLESFSYDVPTFFLPPSHVSPYRQMTKYKAAGVAQHRLDWAGVDELDLPATEDPDECNRMLFAHMERADVLEALADDVDTRLSAFVSATAPSLLAPQRAFLDSLGGNGVAATTDAIRGLVG